MKINAKLSVVAQPVNAQQVTVVNTKKKHVMIVDTTGSMYAELPSIRKQLKEKMFKLAEDNDTLTLIWFSARNQCKTVFADLTIRSLKDLKEIHNMIDREIVARGMTGFVDPLVEAKKVISQISTPDSVVSLWFQTDGYDNQWSEGEILNACKALEEDVMAATIVEYGWNCNRKLLAKMAEAMGGNLIFSTDFNEYDALLESTMNTPIKSTKKVVVDLKYAPKLDYVYALVNDSVVCYQIKDNKVLVPESVTEVFYFAKETDGQENLFATYVGLTTLSQRMESDAIFDVLKALGDINIIDTFTNCFSKQDYIKFQEQCLAVGTQKVKPFAGGRDVKYLPKENAFTVMELISMLSEDDDAVFYPNHDAFDYKRIGAKRVQDESISDTAKAELQQQLTEAKSKEDIDAIVAKLQNLQADVAVKFEFANTDAGVAINGVVFNESRPNISIRARYKGSVALPKDAVTKFGLPEKMETYIYRNYTLVRDGIVNVKTLPVSVSKETYNKLKKEKLVTEAYAKDAVYLLDLTKLPIINRKMVKEVSAKEFFAKVVELEKLKGIQKVFNHYQKQFAPKTSATWDALYGADASAYLKEIGLTEYNGFAPKTVAVPLEDCYKSIELDVSLKGVSSLPSIADVEKKLAANKPLTLRESLVYEGIKLYQAFVESDKYKNAAAQEELLKIWLETETKAIIQKVRALNLELAKSKFAIIIGHVWFKEFASYDENSMEMPILNTTVLVTANLIEKEVGSQA